MADTDTVTREFGRLMESFDLLLVPTIVVRCRKQMDPIRCWARRSSTRGSSGSATLAVIRCRQTRPVSPGVSRPAGFDRDGLPIGVQFDGNFCREDLLLQIAAQLERSRPKWFAAVPRLHVGMSDKALCGIE
jgi:Asp-tRNA(Asn)/Glu-tRNA(Gln) amidotransferase A subunit family amidase